MTTTMRAGGLAAGAGGARRAPRCLRAGALNSPHQSDGRAGPEGRGEQAGRLQPGRGQGQGQDKVFPATLEAMSSKVNLALNAPSCPIHLKFEKEMVTAEEGGERCLPLEVRRLAGDFVDSEECSAVPQGWWRWWRYQGL